MADRGYDADWFRDALREKGIRPCIPAKKNRKQKIKFNGKLYKQWHKKVENLFWKLKGWRRIATCYDHCAHTLLLNDLHSRILDLLPQSMSPEPRFID
ncbi:MAG: transposase [Methylocystaceae bacterium]|nr:transposase [Methylocystaceae bacterium]